MRSTLARAGVLLGATLLTAGCAAQAGGGSAPSPSSSAPEVDAQLPDDGGLVLQVAYSGGFVPPQVTYTQLPLVSVYADGRVITEGPVIAIYPGPALPNLQVSTMPTERVEELVQQALDAGVGEQFDYGMPPVADVPNTRFTVVTADGTETTEVYALQRGLFPEGEAVPGLTEDQTAARAELQGLVDELTGLGGESSQAYEPESIAAVASTNYPPGATPDDIATWPGPPLPGDELSTGSELYCVVARDEAVDAVLEAAADATAETVWQNPDGGRWALTLRPLLPHETGCADLPTA
jgi:hypothetical protein